MNRKYSLRNNKEIGSVVRAKRSVGNKFYTIYYRNNVENKTKIAISVSKKFGNAVMRNYEKRIMREIIRQLLPTVQGYDMVVVIKRNAQTLTFIQKNEQIQKLIKNIKKIGERNDK